jgi:SET domain-containing protein
MIETEFLIFQPSPIHGLGGFAKQALRQGARVVEYVGERITIAESIERCRQGNPCVFRLSEQTHLDGNVDWNPARFINHSCSPNCQAELIHGRIWLLAIRDIRAGEEVTFDYGYDLEDFRAYPCACGAAECAGYIVAEELRSGLRGSKQG